MPINIPIPYNSAKIKKFNRFLVSVILKILILGGLMSGVFFFGYKYYLTRDTSFIVLSLALFSPIFWEFYEYWKTGVLLYN